MKTIAAALAAGSLALAAGAASATTTLDYQNFAAGSTNVDWRTQDGVNPANAAAGAFTMLNEETNESFIAWCIDVLTTLNQGDVEYNLDVSLLDSAQLGRVERVFDANYLGDTALNGINSAAFQVAVWDAVYDDDFNASGFGSAVTSGFKIASPNSVINKANEYLLAAFNYDYAVDDRKWTLTQHEAVNPASQDLITVQAIPGPFGVLLLGSAFAAAGVVRRSARRKPA